jgi:hypothetical protein
MQLGKMGRTNSDSRARLDVRRVLNGHAGQLAEHALAGALRGEAAAILASALLLVFAAKPDQTEKKQ